MSALSTRLKLLVERFAECNELFLRFLRESTGEASVEGFFLSGFLRLATLLNSPIAALSLFLVLLLFMTSVFLPRHSALTREATLPFSGGRPRSPVDRGVSHLLVSTRYGTGSCLTVP